MNISMVCPAYFLKAEEIDCRYLKMLRRRMTTNKTFVFANILPVNYTAHNFVGVFFAFFRILTRKNQLNRLCHIVLTGKTAKQQR